MSEPQPPLSAKSFLGSQDLEILASAWAQRLLGLRSADESEPFETPWGDLEALYHQPVRSSQSERLLALALASGTRSLIRERDVMPEVAVARFASLAKQGQVNVFPVLNEVFGEEARSLWGALPVPLVEGGELSLPGELIRSPRAPWLTAILAFTPVLLVTSVLRFLGRVFLGYRHPARLEVLSHGVELSSRCELLGREISTKKLWVPIGNLARVIREVRYRNTLLYGGLFALVFGSYFGFQLVLDGLRVPGGSVPLLATGAGLILVGLGLDYAFTTAFDSARGRDQLSLEQADGTTFTLGNVNPKDAEAVLGFFRNLQEEAKAEEKEPRSAG